MRIAKLLLLLCLFCESGNLLSQKVNTDSLEKLVQKNNLQDSIRLRLLTELSSAFSKSGSAKTLLFANKLITLATKQNNTVAIGNALYNMAVYYEKVSIYDSSLYFLRNARRITNGADQKLEANIEETMGLNYFRKSSTDSSLACFENALKMQTAIHDSTHILIILNNLGILNSIKGNNLKGQEYFLQCLKIHENRKDSSAIARSNINLGLLMLKAKF
ncbi:MAG: tetratricopeptide repeat protein, partial [Bacteroidia bacterium]|nr:tetratricopeptide repeat protein [Bacteroidia bacterium]